MKLRIKGNSIRLRLLRTEVEQLAADGQVAETVAFPDGGMLTYTVHAAADTGVVTASFAGNAISVSIPATLAAEWISGDAVTIAAEQPTGDGKNLSILIEKDFVCIDRPDDPDRDNAFPNPNVTCRPA